jgi:hypothetical protein
MRVMRGIAGNLSYNVREIQSVNNVIGLKYTPPFPASPANRGSFLACRIEGNAKPALRLGCDLQT